MSIRREPTYLSTEVWRAVFLLARARTARRENSGVTTADEMADGLLREVINEKYPELFEHQKHIDELERKLLAKYQSADD
jgi:hypothetical protein